MALPITAIPPNIAGVSVEARLRMTIEATIPKVAPEVGQQPKQLLQPQTLAIAAGILVIWAGLHFTGVGEVADAAILVVGWIALGAAAWQGARELVAFAIGVKQARTPQDIDRAADHPAKAIGLIGIQAVLSLLLHTAPKPYREPSNLPSKYWKAGGTSVRLHGRLRDVGPTGLRSRPFPPSSSGARSDPPAFGATSRSPPLCLNLMRE